MMGLQNGRFFSQPQYHLEFQNGGRHTGNKYISIHKLYTSMYLRFCDTYKRNSDGYTTWSGSHISGALLWILSIVNGSRKFKKSAAKPEIYKFIYEMHKAYRRFHDTETKFQRLPHMLGTGNLMALERVLRHVTGSRKFKITPGKPEVLISQFLDKLATPF
jgi:hypothetical protein